MTCGKCDNMKLTKEDKALLTSWGYSENDFLQIEKATKKTMTTYELSCKIISREEVIQILGRTEYLSGIARSAFHGSASRGNVYFDSSKLR